MEFREISQNKKPSLQFSSTKKSFTHGKISFKINLEEHYEKAATENGSNKNSSNLLFFLLIKYEILYYSII